MAAQAAIEAQLQLAALNDTILPMVGFSNDGNPNHRQSNQFSALTQLVSLELYQYLEFDQVKHLIKRYQTRYPNQNLGVLVNNNLIGLIWYVKDLVRRQQPIMPDEVTAADIFQGYAAYKAYTANKEKGENMTKLPKYDDKIEFDEWYERVTDVLNMIYGSNLCPIAYVVRLDKPDNWDPEIDARTDLERLTYQLALNGSEFDNDNQEVFKLLKNAVNGTEALSYIEDFILPQDGRGAMMELRQRFEGPNASESRCTKALALLESIVYKNERETPFEAMVNKLNKAYVVLKKNGGQEFTDLMKVDALAKRFASTQSQNLTLKIAIEQMKSMHRSNYREAVAYMSTKVAEINSANRSITGNLRRISQGTTSPTTVSVRNRNGELITSWEGVDLSQPTRTFTAEEMTQLGFRGRGVLAELRRIANGGRETNPAGRGPGRGFYRGGRGRGMRGRGRGGRGAYGRHNYTYGRGGYQNNANGSNNNENRQVNAATTAPDSASSSSAAQNPNNGANQNSNTIPPSRGNQNGSGYGQH